MTSKLMTFKERQQQARQDQQVAPAFAYIMTFVIIVGLSIWVASLI